MLSFSSFITEQAELNEEVSQHHRAAIHHGYKNGTAVGTSGYYTKDGDFVFVYKHPKQHHEIHISGSKGNWTHTSEKGIVHRTGSDHKDLWSHLRQFHPEVKEGIEKKKQAKEKSEMDKTVAKKQGKLIDKMVNSSKLPAITLNVGASAATKPKAKTKPKKKK